VFVFESDDDEWWLGAGVWMGWNIQKVSGGAS